MSQSSRFIKVHPDALVEWIQDDNFFYADNYSVIKDTLNSETGFAFSKTAQDPVNYNKIPSQLYLIDPVVNRYGIADPDVKTFLQEAQYSNPAPSRFDKIKLWFPLSYTFPNSTGFMLKMWSLAQDNLTDVNLSNFYLDTSIPANLGLVTSEPVPFRYGERLWGKTITIYVPSVYSEARNVQGNSPTLGSINEHLAGVWNGFSQTSPIFIDFRFLTQKVQVLTDFTFLTTPSLVVSVPQAPEYSNLSVQINRAIDGDYFQINGAYNGTVGEFDSFMQTLEQSGKKSYVLFLVTTFEESLQQDTQNIYKYQDYVQPIDWVPILKVTNTTASIQVEMQLISAVDGSVISRFAEIAIVGSEVAKYGKVRQSINLSNAFKPKLYNSKPDNLVLPAQDLIKGHISRKVRAKQQDIRYVPYPVLTDNFNIIAQEITTQKNGSTYYGKGGLTIELTPFDNVLKFRIATLTSSNTQNPYSFPSSDSVIQLVFKSATSELRVPLWTDSGENNLVAGILVFKQVASDHTTLKKIFDTSQNFYITVTSNGVENSVYDGQFSLLEERSRINQGTSLNLDALQQQFLFSNPVSSVAAINKQAVTAAAISGNFSSSPTAIQSTSNGGISLSSQTTSTQQKALDNNLTAKQLKNIS